MELYLKDRKVFGTVEEERKNKMKSLCGSATETELIFLGNLSRFQRSENKITKALEYAKTLDFSKSALRSSYLSHPIRVADSLLRMDPAVAGEALVTAILHNVPETTNVTLTEIQANFGSPVASNIGMLLVDRKTPFSSIKETYYSRLESAGPEIRLIKLLDKMDNLFVLCLNSDNSVRRQYIAEVREKLLPFALSYDAGLGRYLAALLEDTARMGFSQKLKDKLQAYQQHEKMGAVS